MNPLSEFRGLVLRGLAEIQGSGTLLFSRIDDVTLTMVALCGLAIVAALARTALGRQPGRTQIALPALLSWATPATCSFVRHVPLLFALAGLPFLMLALGDPFTTLQREEVTFPGRRIAIMIDASSSMVAKFQAPRLSAGAPNQATFFTTVAAAETFIRQRIQGRYHDLIALIEFGDEAYVVTPFTADYDNVLLSLSLVNDWTEFTKFPSRGTTIGKAVQQSVALFRTFDFLDAAGNLMLIISDGQDSNAIIGGTTVTEILADARKAKIPVYFIRVSFNKGVGDVLPDHVWKPAIESTGGKFYAASDESVIFQAISEIDRRSVGAIATKRYGTGQPEFSRFAAVAATFWLIAVALQLSIRYFRTFP